MGVLMKIDVKARKNKLSKRFLSYGNRSLTDIEGFAFVLLCLMFLYAPLRDNGHLWGDHPKYGSRRNDSNEMNELWQNYNSTNASNNATCNTTQLRDLITHMLKTEELISGYKVWDLKEIMVGVVVVNGFVQMSATMVPIVGLVKDGFETVVHFTIINAIRIIVESTFYLAIYFQSTASWSFRQYMSYGLLLGLLLPNILTFMIIIMGFVQLVIFRRLLSKEDIETLKDTTRFYVARCYLLLFRCIILVIIVLYVIFIIISLKDLLDQSSRYIIFFIVPSFYIVFCLHTFGEIVIMTATASHNWDQHEKAISFKSLLWAIAIVSRYHLGSVLFGTFFGQTLGMMNERQILWPNSIFYTKHTITRLSRMLIAVLGKNHMEAERIISTHFIEKAQSPPITKSKSTKIWIPLLEMSTIWILTWLPILRGPSLALKLSLIFGYLAIVGTVSYVITAIDIIESTIQFVNMEVEGFDEHEIVHFAPRE